MGRSREARDGRSASGREASLRAVFEALAAHGPRSRADLARDLAISPASVSRVAEGLVAAGLVAEGERVSSRVGRPQTPLGVNPRAATVAAISVRSRFVRLLLAGLDGRPLHRAMVTREEGSPESLAAQLRSLLQESLAAHAAGRDVGAVVVGFAGAWDATRGRVHAAPQLPAYEGVDLAALLQAALGDLVVGGCVALDNDVNFAALGEHAYGAARGVDDFYYLNLGAGIGGAAVVGGRVHRGVHGFAGEIGYLPVWLDGARLPLEQVVGRRALERFAAGTGSLRAGEDVDEHLERAGPGADAVAEHVGRHLATALIAIVTILDPRLIVLGGAVGRYAESWTARIREQLEGSVPEVPRIVGTALGRDASLLGAVVQGTALAREALLIDRLAT